MSSEHDSYHELASRLSETRPADPDVRCPCKQCVESLAACMMLLADCEKTMHDVRVELMALRLKHEQSEG